MNWANLANYWVCGNGDAALGNNSVLMKPDFYVEVSVSMTR